MVDCAHADTGHGSETGVLASDFVLDIQVQGAGLADYPGIGHITAEAEVDLPFPDRASDAEISGHPLSNAVDGPGVWKDLARDMAVMVLDPEVSDRGQSFMFPIRPRCGRRPAFFASALVHGSFICLMALFPVSNVAGTTDGTGNVIMMRVVAHEEVIPQDASPGSIDSAESAPSKAKRDKHREQPPPEPLRIEQETQETGPDPGKIVMQEKPEDKENGDSTQDSAASLPSTASAERRFIPAAGQEGNAFDARVLSAIREAIFFPKAALNQRHHGEVEVSFAITKDGSLKDLRITKPSESAPLNESALKIIEKAAKKFPPIPDTVYRERLEYVVPILFKEKKGS
jgi:TonB family protein